MAEREKGEQFTQGLINTDKKVVDHYIPRKCTYTNRIIYSKDKASIQLNFAEVDEQGRATEKYQTVCIAGQVRSRGQSDLAIQSILKERDFLPIKY